ncbi:DUF7800 domain-containing protein [Kytococcus sp. Marseille-QA3725]
MSASLLIGPLLRHVDHDSAAVWVETDAPARVEVRLTGGDQPGGSAGSPAAASASATTFTAHGHHYALVELTGLPSGLDSTYELLLDGNVAWPEPGEERPAPRINTLTPGAPVDLGFGSCRTSVPHDAPGHHTHGVDALRALGMADATGQDGAPELPELMLLLGDQVYADATSQAMQDFIASRRSLEEGPGEELADYEEYAHLYLLAWGEPWVRWLLATLPTLMIFDDHDVRDDWNTSAAWREEMEATDWWHDRIVAALGSYWVYQHLGNLSVSERAHDEIWREIVDRQRTDPHPDVTELLDAFAERVDEHPDTYRWSYARDLGTTRLVVVDSRAARVMEPGRREMLDEQEMAWLSDQLQGGEGIENVILGTSLPFLLPRGLHHLEAWSEAVCNGVFGQRMARIGERLRTTVDLEHWAAFHNSFLRVCAMVGELARGERGPAPRAVVFLSGDVHHSYISEVDPASLLDDEKLTGEQVERGDAEDAPDLRVLQLVCSPIRNPLPTVMRFATALLAHGLAVPLGALAGRSAAVPTQPWRWRDVAGPWFTNNVALLRVDGCDMQASWWTGEVRGGDHEHPVLVEVETLDLGQGEGAAG